MLCYLPKWRESIGCVESTNTKLCPLLHVLLLRMEKPTVWNEHIQSQCVCQLGMIKSKVPCSKKKLHCDPWKACYKAKFVHIHYTRLFKDSQKFKPNDPSYSSKCVYYSPSGLSSCCNCSPSSYFFCFHIFALSLDCGLWIFPFNLLLRYSIVNVLLLVLFSTWIYKLKYCSVHVQQSIIQL